MSHAASAEEQRTATHRVAQGIATIPEFFWELSLRIYLTVRGFKASPILSGAAQ